MSMVPSVSVLVLTKLHLSGAGPHWAVNAAVGATFDGPLPDGPLPRLLVSSPQADRSPVTMIQGESRREAHCAILGERELRSRQGGPEIVKMS